MKAIVIFIFVLTVFRIGVRAHRIYAGTYPRIQRWTKAEDQRGLIFTIALAIWCGWVLLA